MNRSIAHWINDVCVWIDQTALSQTIQSTAWIVPTVQSVHILAIAAVAASALMINLRLLGIFAADQPLKDVLARFLPFVWWPLLVLLATGAIMIFGEPARSLKNPAFQLKMALLIAAVIATMTATVLHKRNPAFAERTNRGVFAPGLAILSMALWTGIGVLIPVT